MVFWMIGSGIGRICYTILLQNLHQRYFYVFGCVVILMDVWVLNGIPLV